MLVVVDSLLEGVLVRIQVVVGDFFCCSQDVLILLCHFLTNLPHGLCDLLDSLIQLPDGLLNIWSLVFGAESKGLTVLSLFVVRRVGAVVLMLRVRTLLPRLPGTLRVFHFLSLLDQVLGLPDEFDVPVLLDHLVNVALQHIWDLVAKNEGSVLMVDLGVPPGVGVHIGLLVVLYTPHSVQRHAYEFFLQEIVEQELKVLANAGLRHWNLPQDALVQVWMCFHDVS